MRVRLDKALVERGLASTRSRAQFVIKSGTVHINERLIDRVSHLVDEKDVVRIIEDPNPWVSRAALKLVYAIDVFDLAPLGGLAMDIGASTGGFTQVLLAFGCSKVYAIDVGRGQLDTKLKQDSRILNLEGMNAKEINSLDLPFFDYIVCDASFISFKKVIETPLLYGGINCRLIGLIKPQFEVGPNKVGKRGIVKDSFVQKNACLDVKLFLDEKGWEVTHLKACPFLGSDGNVEFLIAAKKKKF